MGESGVHREAAGTEPVAAIDRLAGRRRSDRIVGAGRATREAVDLAMAAAAASLPVRIVGPPGSGRRHFARAIHSWGSRAAGPFVSVSCAAGNDTLIGLELFGGAAAAHPQVPVEQPGALSLAATGTLFLSSIDRLAETHRQALAKALVEGRYQREGDGESIPLRARVIASSPANPDTSPFGDLPQLTIRLLPLADRSEDVLPLAAHFLRLFADEAGVSPVGFTSDAREALLAESWSGNVRELAERIRQAIKLAGSGAITAEALLLAADGEEIPSFKDAKRAFETRYVIGLLRRCGGNISRAARLAKKDRKDFYDVIRRTGVDPSDFR
jgi:two-component system response regulator GlrR